MKINKYTPFKIKIIFLLILFISFSSCYEYPELTDIQYEDYRRVIGPDGGTINFYANYENDSIEDILVRMEFPENALDSLVVFNMYEFNNDFVENDLENLDMYVNTQFLYFVPFYESEGYVAHDNEDDIGYHLSINFNSPVGITYNLDNYLEENETLPDNSTLYRIKIPSLDEWDENIWVNWNIQGYPDGYDNIDLIYLITGRWTGLSGWSNGDLSIDNWEEVDTYTYDNISKTITFNIENTDYMYVMGDDVDNK